MYLKVEYLKVERHLWIVVERPVCDVERLLCDSVERLLCDYAGASSAPRSPHDPQHLSILKCESSHLHRQTVTEAEKDTKTDKQTDTQGQQTDKRG